MKLGYPPGRAPRHTRLERRIAQGNDHLRVDLPHKLAEVFATRHDSPRVGLLGATQHSVRDGTIFYTKLAENPTQDLSRPTNERTTCADLLRPRTLPDEKKAPWFPHFGWDQNPITKRALLAVPLVFPCLLHPRQWQRLLHR